jgi:signal peptidase I
MQNERRKKQKVDPFTVISRLTRDTVIIIAVVVAIKLLLLDIVAVRGDQMTPSIQNRDFVLTFRLPYLPLIRNMFKPSRNQPVIFTYPFSKKRGCLRIAGIPGDTILVDSGVVRNSRNKTPAKPLQDSVTPIDLLPEEYSPRDFMPPLVLPNPGTVLVLDSLDLFPFFTALSIIRQENPQSNCSLSVALEVNGTVAADYYLSDFVLYKGTLNAVPDSQRFDWFFWSRLTEYLHLAYPERMQRLVFSFIKDGERVTRYTVRERYIFLIADQEKTGYDSRYFGPVRSSHVFGRPLAVLWSFSLHHGINLKRLGKVIP